MPASLTFLVDGEPLQTVKEPPFRASLDTLRYAEGRHVLSLVAVDASQRTASASRTINVVRVGDCDNPPALSFEASTPGRASKRVVDLKVIVSDDIGITSVQFFNGSTLFAETSQPPWSAKWDPNPFGPGTYQIKAVATDTKGQTAQAVHPITIDRTGPIVKLTAPKDGLLLSGAVHFAASVTETDELASVEFRVDGMVVGRAISAPFEATVFGLTPGPHSAYAEAADVLGNTGTSMSISFIQVADAADGGEPDGGALDGGSTDGGPPDAGRSCSGRCDCTGDGEICVLNKCQQAAADKSCVRDGQCPLGTICDFSRKCVPGCAEACDCVGSKICNTTTLQCEVCSRTNPCPDGQMCNTLGACEPMVQCSSVAQCPSGQTCKNAHCGYCVADADCNGYGTGFQCNAWGLCEDRRCSDASCRASLNNPKAYCNQASNSCDIYECLSSTDCAGGATCNTTTHRCISGGSCSADCNGKDCASQQMVCDMAICTCTSSLTANLCGPANAGLAVKPDCTACSLQDLLVGVTCVDAADPSYQCSPGFAVFMFSALAGYIICD
jgi:hypothetical protein